MIRLISITIVFAICFTKSNADELTKYGKSRKALFERSLPFHNSVIDEGAEIILAKGRVLLTSPYVSGSDPAPNEFLLIVSYKDLVWRCLIQSLGTKSCRRYSSEPMF